MIHVEFHEPHSLDETIALLQRYDDAWLLAGGTDLIIAMERRLVRPAHLINLLEVPGLDHFRPNDGMTVVLNTGAAEIGTGAVTAGAAQVLAEELGVELADITVVSADTDSTPYDLGALGSRTALSVGNAARRAAVINHFYPTFNSPSFHAHTAEVEVDPDTGQITVHRYVVAQDVGLAINPSFVEGQIEGGVAQGLGQALTEEIMIRDGQVLNPNLTDYKMPTIIDVPQIETILVEHPSEIGPYGAKGVGEAPAIEPPATIANAVEDAIGIRIRSLPITAEKVLKALKSR